jgi:hypothetical protein
MTKTSQVPLNDMTADEISNVFFRAHGWLRLKTGDGSGLWINPFTRALASYESRVLLVTEHETNMAFCGNFSDMALLCLQKTGIFPTADVRDDAKMVERLRTLGLDPIVEVEEEKGGE